ncbi:MAG TPA: hypothetical protein VFO58_07075 [Vicinamibacterales bacterium]|nr:hypothetical protein [Vicinamibacterales bacterium]
MPRSKARCLIALLSASLAVASCGEDGSNGNPVSSTQVSTPRLLREGSFFLAAPDEDFYYYDLVPVTDAASGRWEAAVDWALASNELWMWVATGACTTQQFESPECPFEVSCPCQFAVRSEAATPKPRVLTIPNAQGGTRTLIVLNLGPREDNVTYRVTLTPSTLLGSPPRSVSDDRSHARVSTGRKAVLRR